MILKASPYLKNLQRAAISLYRTIEKKQRNLEQDRVRLGKLLLRIKREFIKAQGGSELRRGRNGGFFCKWLTDAGFNVGTAYAYMILARTGNWKIAETASRTRIVFWQQFAKSIRKAETNDAKKKLLVSAISYLQTTYNIEAKVVVK